MNLLAWQGWRLKTPENWNPVKIEGDYSAGYVLLADLHQPRLGVKWATIPRRRNFDAAAWVARMMRNEVGQLAAAEARAIDLGPQWKHSLLYEEPKPPGRDVWVACSSVSGRVLQLACHVHNRRHVLRDKVMELLTDQAANAPVFWSVFELCCRVPAGFVLQSHRLNAGDLSLTFAASSDARKSLMVRQVAVADLALQRLPLERWLATQQRQGERHYRITGEANKVEITLSDRTLTGLAGQSRRRARFFWMRRLSRSRFAYALLDQKRNRLVMVESSDDALAAQTAATVGNADVCENQKTSAECQGSLEA